MIKKIIFSILLFIFLFNTCAYALDYSFSARIVSTGTKKYKAVKLIPQIYNNTAENLADLEIFDENNEPVPYFINSFSENLGKKEYFTETFKPDFDVEEEGNSTVIKVHGLKNLKLVSISLVTPSVFKRNVTFDGRASKMLYNLRFNNEEQKDLTLTVEPYKVTSDIGEIVIDNKDDKPIEVTAIEATYLVDELVFEGSGSKEYTLKFGNSEIKKPKSYDLSNYKEYILNEGYDVLSIEDIKGSPAKDLSSVKEPYDYKTLFNIGVSIVAVVLSVIIFLKIKK
ncbi:MAG TPA: hypothetical protein PKW03_02290 [Acetivibrio sp.]|nr:hypothetical protein [Acetivibrio sp.]HPT90369.1 hypothetical protein [Acetivibrio sp.]